MKKYIVDLLANNPLCSISTYSDTLDLSNGSVSRKIKKYIFTGNETVFSCVPTIDGQNYCIGFRFSDFGMTDIKDFNAIMTSIPYPIFISSHFSEKTNTNSEFNNIQPNQVGANSVMNDTNNRYIIFCVSGLTTKEAYLAWFAQQYANGTPVTVWYVLATAETDTITVPTGLTGIVNGYLTQSGTPTPTSPIYPTANHVTMWANYTPNIYNSGWTTASGQPEQYNGGWI